MILLGLDLGTKTGWCLYDAPAQKIIESGVQTFDLKRGESDGLRFMHFRMWISSVLTAAWDISLIAYEQPHLRGGAAAHLLVGFSTRVQEAATEAKIESVPVHTGTLKRHATGYGNAWKADMIIRSSAFLGRHPIDDNEDDAVHVARWAADEFFWVRK
jgi:Holliday junction resolvasome RuvABC endonuclease subunit